MRGAREAEKIEKEKQKEELKKKMGQASDKTVKNSLPGFSNRPGTLSQSKSSSNYNAPSLDSFRNNDPNIMKNPREGSNRNVKGTPRFLFYSLFVHFFFFFLGSSSSMNGHLEQQLGPEVLARMEQARAGRVAAAQEQQMQRRRDSTPRSLARPVEAILRLYRTEREDDLPDMYAVLGLQSGCEEEGALKRAYRSLALLLHPGEPALPPDDLADSLT